MNTITLVIAITLAVLGAEVGLGLLSAFRRRLESQRARPNPLAAVNDTFDRTDATLSAFEERLGSWEARLDKLDSQAKSARGVNSSDSLAKQEVSSEAGVALVRGVLPDPRAVWLMEAVANLTEHWNKINSGHVGWLEVSDIAFLDDVESPGVNVAVMPGVSDRQAKMGLSSVSISFNRAIEALGREQMQLGFLRDAPFAWSEQRAGAFQYCHPRCGLHRGGLTSTDSDPPGARRARVSGVVVRSKTGRAALSR